MRISSVYKSESERILVSSLQKNFGVGPQIKISYSGILNKRICSIVFSILSSFLPSLTIPKDHLYIESSSAKKSVIFLYTNSVIRPSVFFFINLYLFPKDSDISCMTKERGLIKCPPENTPPTV